MLKKILKNVSRNTKKKAEKKPPTFWVKVVCFTLPLVGSAYYFGTVLARVGTSHEFLRPPWTGYLSLIAPLIFSMAAMLIMLGLIAALFRPVWLSAIALVLSGSAMLLGWGLVSHSVVFTSLFVLIALLYVIKVKRELDQRTKFTTEPVSKKQKLIAIILIIMTCGSLYFGYTEYFKVERFTEKDSAKLSEIIRDNFVKYMVPKETTEAQKQQVKDSMKADMDKAAVKIFEGLPMILPAFLAATLVSVLIMVSFVLRLLMAPILNLLLRILKLSKILKTEYEKVEVERLVM
jgi:hypothetical protein